MKNLYYYIGENPTCDLIIENPNNEILLAKRGANNNACPNMWALPGGFIDSISKQGEKWIDNKESPEDAAIRELAEETNLILINPKLTFLGIYEGNNRDPRDNLISWSKSFAFYYQINQETFSSQKNKIKGMDGMDECDWFTKDEIQNTKLAFDHNIIINNFYLQKNKKPKI